MAHAAVTARSGRYGPAHFMIRNRLYSGLRNGTMQTGALADDERLKMLLPQACCYCGSRQSLAADHLIARHRGGAHSGDNLVWACRNCNSSKGAKDALEWLTQRHVFPPLLLLRRYLKLAIGICSEKNLMDVLLDDAPELPFALTAIPRRFPSPGALCLWVTDSRVTATGASALTAGPGQT